MKSLLKWFFIFAATFLTASEGRQQDIQAISTYFKFTDPAVLQLYALEVLGTATKILDVDSLVAKVEQELVERGGQEAVFSSFSDEELKELRAIYENPVFQKVQPSLFSGWGEQILALMQEILEREGAERSKEEVAGNVIEITEENFCSEVLLSHLPIVIDFYTDHCYPCRVLAPILEAFSKKYHQELRFARLNCDLQRRLANHFRLRGVPTLLFFEPGNIEPFKKIVGLVPKEQLEREFSSFKKESAH